MRISDWSSDVCSSDLLADRGARELVGLQLARREFAEQLLLPRVGGRLDAVEEDLAEGVAQAAVVFGRIVAVRSEEHTSELQSLMRISYAVFCLKKKNKTANIYLSKRDYTEQN